MVWSIIALFGAMAVAGIITYFALQQFQATIQTILVPQYIVPLIMVLILIFLIIRAITPW